jgi:hypothetical protein
LSQSNIYRLFAGNDHTRYESDQGRLRTNREDPELSQDPVQYVAPHEQDLLAAARVIEIRSTKLRRLRQKPL